MGYSHYWIQLISVPPSVTLKIIEEIKLLFSKLNDVQLRGADGSGDYIINDHMILFNGCDDLAHEPFVFKFNEPPCGGIIRGFNFCKTIRKPYDIAVCLALLSIANNFRLFMFSSDGDYDDWKPAIEMYEQHIRKLNFKFVDMCDQYNALLH